MLPHIKLWHLSNKKCQVIPCTTIHSLTF
uniref:Uncharacterized protein n=1 Tax=Anguilla anguilla TaxID=7936 RepID=A0A0E9W3W4_ANGAN